MPGELHALDDPMIGCRPELPVAPIVIQLLAAAGQALSPAQTSTKRLIDRAISLLDRDSTKDVLRDTEGRFTGGLAHWQVKRVSQFIDRNLAAPLPIEKLAAVADLSPCHFCRAFKKCLGTSPHAYIVRKRAEKAQELMLGTDEPLVQIALSCGLASQSHLCQIFRRVVGCSPSAWRRQYRTGQCEKAPGYAAM